MMLGLLTANLLCFFLWPVRVLRVLATLHPLRGDFCCYCRLFGVGDTYLARRQSVVWRAADQLLRGPRGLHATDKSERKPCALFSSTLVSWSAQHPTRKRQHEILQVGVGWRIKDPGVLFLCFTRVRCVLPLCIAPRRAPPSSCPCARALPSFPAAPRTCVLLILRARKDRPKPSECGACRRRTDYHGLRITSMLSTLLGALLRETRTNDCWRESAPLTNARLPLRPGLWTGVGAVFWAVSLSCHLPGVPVFCGTVCASSTKLGSRVVVGYLGATLVHSEGNRSLSGETSFLLGTLPCTVCFMAQQDGCSSGSMGLPLPHLVAVGP